MSEAAPHREVLGRLVGAGTPPASGSGAARADLATWATAAA